MIKYPCVFKLAGDDELIYLNAEHELLHECESLIWHEDDRLIDSTGQRYLVHLCHDKLAYSKQGEPLTIEEITELIQAHHFSQVEVCLTKIQFKTVFDAISSLGV